jgi:hypothetical protein
VTGSFTTTGASFFGGRGSPPIENLRFGNQASTFMQIVFVIDSQFWWQPVVVARRVILHDLLQSGNEYPGMLPTSFASTGV